MRRFLTLIAGSPGQADKAMKIINDLRCADAVKVTVPAVIALLTIPTLFSLLASPGAVA